MHQIYYNRKRINIYILMTFKRHLSLPDLFYIVVCFLIGASAFFIQISPLTYNNYLTICNSNYAPGSDFDRCMAPYWSQYQLTIILVKIIAVISISTLLVYLMHKFAKKLR